MEIAEIYYKAKDGKIFTDPLKCEDYEKTLGVLPGSVGRLIQELEKLNPKFYICGIVYIKEKDCGTIYCRCTTCCDHLLEDYVNVEDLQEYQRYLYQTAGEFVKELKKKDKDYPCQWMIVFSENIKMSKPGIMANYNQEVWDK